MAYKGTRRVKRGQLSTAQQKVHVAPQRLGDGMKPNHAERTCTITAPKVELTLDDMVPHQH